MTITHKLKMDLGEEGLLPSLEMPLGDTGSREIELYLYANQNLWIIPDDATVVIRYKKPDGTVGEYDTLPDGTTAWSKYDNLLTLAVAPQVLTVAGSVVLYACLYQEEQILQTFAMEILVKAPVVGMRSVTSEDYTYMTNVLRGPVTAEAGQVLAVATVDTYGRVTAVEAVDAATLVDNNGSAVLHKAQTLNASQKFQARTNIEAASQAMVDFLLAKYTAEGRIVMSDDRTGDMYTLYVSNGKLTLEKE